jgi:hypothetical protein
LIFRKFALLGAPVRHADTQVAVMSAACATVTEAPAATVGSRRAL